MSKDTKLVIAGIAMVVGLLGGVFGVAWFKAAQEAKAYNRMTGGDATTWEALFVELRVDGSR